MCLLLAGARSFTFEAEETYEVALGQRRRYHRTNVWKIALERPDHFRSVAVGDTARRASWYDGNALSVLNAPQHVYSSFVMPATIDAVLDEFAEALGIFLPFSDFLYSDPYARLMNGVVYGECLGLHNLEGVHCHHLAFTQEDAQWQLWIDAGAQPLPRRFAIAYVDEPGVPQFEAKFRKWTLPARVPPETFRFRAPAGARRVEGVAIVAGGH